MSSRFSSNSPLTKFIIIFEFILVAYLLYSLTINIYKKGKLDNLIAEFEAENELIREENKIKNADYLYYTSPEYIDKFAKNSLLLINPGEEVIVIKDSNLDSEQLNSEETEAEVANNQGKSNPELWWELFFD